jgi:hypothetical protein
MSMRASHTYVLQFDLQLHAGILWLTAIGVPVIKATTSMLWVKSSAQSVWAAGVARLMSRAAKVVELLDEGASPPAAAHTKSTSYPFRLFNLPSLHQCSC